MSKFIEYFDFDTRVVFNIMVMVQMMNLMMVNL